MVDRSLFSSAKEDWNTPDYLLDLVRKVAPIGLDPCSNERSTVKAALAYDREQDGLASPWGGLGLVYVNPPYGRGVYDWIAKCRNEAAHGAQIIALVAARTDTKWFQGPGATAQLVCFWRGRVRFVCPTDDAVGAPFPSVLLYWGSAGATFSAVFSGYGRILKPEIYGG